MNPALWGLLTAVSWGSADFIARFTGRALGPRTALLAMLGVGAVAFSLLLWRRGVVPVLDPAGWWLLLLSASKGSDSIDFGLGHPRPGEVAVVAQAR
ncbi:MAG: EamA family transporter [Kiloniellales bacterium]